MLQRQFHLARAQGDACAAAVDHLLGGQRMEQRAGDYWVGYSVEPAQGMYEWRGDGLTWREPDQADLHLEITLRDAGDGRCVPGARITVTVIDSEDREIGTHVHPMVWHPLVYHYGRDWPFAAGERYRLRVRIDPPRFMRHDQLNGARLSSAAELVFDDVEIPRRAFERSPE